MKFSIIKKNNLYEQVYDLLDMEELNMNNPHHQEKIYYHINKFILNNKSDIFYSDNFTDKELFYEELFVQLTNNDNKDDGSQGNTQVLFADKTSMYEMVHLENFNIKYEESQMNQFATVSNPELKPIYGNCAIIKTLYENGEYVISDVNPEDISKVFMNNFYHDGVMIDVKDNMIDVQFAGTEPNNFIGSLFKPYSSVEIFGLHLVPFIEEGDKINNIASKLLGTQIKGRVYMTTLCAPNNTKFWNLCKKDIEDILDINNYPDKVKEINNEFVNNKFTNPFFLLKKYR